MTRGPVGIALLLAAALFAAQAASHLKAGAERIQRGDAEGAIRELKAALAEDPKNAAGHLLLGQAYLLQHSIGTVAEAKAELQQALDLDSSLIWARFYLAKVYIDLGLSEKARDQLQRGLDVRPDVPHFLSLLGEVERKLGNPERSIELNRQALARDASMSPAHYYIALAYLDLKQDDLAVRELNTALASPYVAPEMYVTLATVYLRRGDAADAESLCRKALAMDPERAETRVTLARALNARKSPDDAITAIRPALPEAGGRPATPYYQQLQADAYVELGRAYEAKDMRAQAVEAYSRALEFDPDRVEVRRRIDSLR